MKAEIAEVEQMGDRKKYTILVTAPGFTPQRGFEMRARMRTLIGEGLFENIEEVMDNLSAGEVERVTKIRGNIKTEDKRLRMVERKIGVIVDDDTSSHMEY